MKLDFKVIPDPVTPMAEEIAAAERAVTTGVDEVGVRLKADWRAQVVGAGLGHRLGNTIRSERDPKQGSSIGAAALVWSKAPVIVGARCGATIGRGRGCGSPYRCPSPVNASDVDRSRLLSGSARRARTCV